MAVQVTYRDARDAARTVDALLTAASFVALANQPLLARKYRRLADELADAIDAEPGYPTIASRESPHWIDERLDAADAG